MKASEDGDLVSRRIYRFRTGSRLKRLGVAAVCAGLLASGVSLAAAELASAPASASPTWSLQPITGISDLSGVYCTSASTCMVTGGLPSAAVTTNSGSTWTNESSSGSLPGYFIHSSWCTAGLSWCIAVGGRGTSPDGAVGVWNGSSWTDASTALHSAVTSFNGLSAVSCASQGTCVATGDFDDGVAVAYTDNSGASWTDETSNLPSSMDYTGGVSCVGLTCMVVGQGQSGASSAPAAAISTDGGQDWTSASSGLPSTADARFHAVDCVTASFCMAVGPVPSGGSPGAPYAAVWNGLTWNVVTSALPTLAGTPYNGGLTGVSCASTSDCAVVGDRGDAKYAGDENKLFVTTNGGSSWVDETSMLPSGISGLSQVSCAGSACYVVGRTSSTNHDPVAYSPDAFPVPPPLQSAPTLTSVSPASGPANGGTSVTLTGTNLANAAYVLFGGKDATGVVDVSPTEVSATTPPGVAGSSVPVQVITPGGTSPSSPAPSFTYSPAPPAPPAYYPLASPTRICDTRAGNPSGLSGAALTNCEGKALSAGSPLSIQVSGLGGVPSDASAVMANLTAIDPSSPGSLVAYPGAAQPPTASTIRFGTASNTAGLTEVGLSSSGAIEVATSVSSVQLAVDVEGYVAPEGSSRGPSSGALYEALPSPSRICDTRSGNPSNLSGEAAQCEGNTLSPNTPLQVQVSGLAGIPSGATAVVVNLTAIAPAEGGYLSAYPAGSSVPTASNVNFTRGQIVANRAVVTLSSSGAIDLVSDASLNVAVDVSGYFTASGATGSGFHPLADPVRVCDTRPTSAANPCSAKAPGPGGVLGVTLTGVAGVPSDASAVVVELSAIDPTSGGYLSVYPAGSSRPVVSELNFTPGVDVTNLVIATLPTSGVIDVYNYSGTTQVTVDVLGWYQSG